jgi:formamidopyrimidine-DNA glycosylase
MPELPDVTIYVEAIRDRVLGKRLDRIRLLTPYVLRSVDPPISACHGKTVEGVERLGKRIVLALEDELYVVVHLMIAGRFLWKKPGEGGLRPGGKIGLAAFEFESGVLVLTEASSHKRAMIHAVKGRQGLELHRPPGIEPLECTLADFAEALSRENRTLKRALTNPAWFSGIGNAYSDEILHAARLSPVRLTGALTEAEVQTLFEATRRTLTEWTDRLRTEFAGRFPEKGQITAFRPDFASHGKFGKPCPECGMPIQRISYAENETNYCARCQNEDRVLADRSLSRLLKSDWPRTIEEMVEGPRTPGG